MLFFNDLFRLSFFWQGTFLTDYFLVIFELSKLNEIDDKKYEIEDAEDAGEDTTDLEKELEDLEDETTVLRVDDETIIYQNY